MRRALITALPFIAALSICGCGHHNAAPSAANAPQIGVTATTFTPNLGPLPTAPPLTGQIPTTGVLAGLLPRVGPLTITTTTNPVPPCEAFTLTSVLFGTNSATLTADSSSDLDTVADKLKSREGIVTIVGYTDPRPTSFPGGNQGLSEARAGSVRDALDSRGVPNINHVEGLGAQDLVDAGTTEAAYQRNRRVEITLECTVEQPLPGS